MWQGWQYPGHVAEAQSVEGTVPGRQGGGLCPVSAPLSSVRSGVDLGYLTGSPQSACPSDFCPGWGGGQRGAPQLSPKARARQVGPGWSFTPGTICWGRLGVTPTFRQSAALLAVPSENKCSVSPFHHGTTAPCRLLSHCPAPGSV